METCIIDFMLLNKVLEVVEASETESFSPMQHHLLSCMRKVETYCNSNLEPVLSSAASGPVQRPARCPLKEYLSSTLGSFQPPVSLAGATKPWNPPPKAGSVLISYGICR
jgi:hypothetical protein